MNDVDTRIKDLINSAVDRELDGHRSAPPLDRSRLAERPSSASRVARWSLPVLAASMAALLAVGALLVINNDRVRRSGPVGNSGSPTPSVSRSTDPDQEEAARAYSEAVAGAREASEVAGVSVAPLSAEDAVHLKNRGALRADTSSIANPQRGRTYAFTMSYLAGPGEPIAVVSIDVRDVASGSCPQPFLTRAAYTYRMRCQVTFLADALGTATLTVRSPHVVSSISVNLSLPANYPVSPRPVVQEATEVAGVSVGPESTDTPPGYTGLGGPFSEFSGKTLTPGKSYPFVVEYLVASGGAKVTVLSLELHNVASGSCPGPFLIRPAHTYRIRCQVSFLTTAAGELTAIRRAPTDVEGYSQTTPLIEFPSGP